MVQLRNAASAFKLLDGIICLYKPSCVPVKQVLHTIKTNLCRDLNALPDRQQEQRVEIVGATDEPMKVKLLPNYADNTLVCGLRYVQEDIRCTWASYLGLFSSGILIIGVNEGTKLSFKMNVSRLTRAYKVHGQLGKATDTYFWNGKTIERSTFGHITRSKIDGVVAHMQAAHQKTMFELSGLDISSQTAYDLAAQGLIRPANNKVPVLYGIKCVYFDPPNFTLEIQSVNEYEKYLWTVVHDLGIQLKTSAHCTGVQCIRHGKFQLEHALLRKHWQLNHIIDNISMCRDLLEENEVMVKPKSAHLSM